MPPESLEPLPEAGLIIQRPAGLVTHPQGGSPALSEMISRSLAHLRISKSLAVPERRAGEEQEFEIAPGVKMVMCWTPAGDFLMGSPEDELEHFENETQHLVRITRGFWMGKYPVTQAQWEPVMGSNRSRFKGGDLPVECVSWEEISGSGGFMEKANRFGTAGGVFSLPTEAQWEYACRAGTVTALNSGKELTSTKGACPNLDEIAWYGENSDSKTHPVGLKRANAWGLHDMHGNVFEWCADVYADCPFGPVADPRGPDSGSYRVCRGGGWRYYAYACRVAGRGAANPSYRDYGLGFRIARSFSPRAAASNETKRTE